jgi:hypothetical protein
MSKPGYKVAVSAKTIATATAVLSHDSAAAMQERGQPERYETYGVTSRAIQRLEEGTYKELGTLQRDVCNIRQMIAATQGEHTNHVVLASEADKACTELWELEQTLETSPEQFEQQGGRATSRAKHRPARTGRH